MPSALDWNYPNAYDCINEFERIPEAVLVLDASYRIILVNRTCEVMMGFHRDSLLGQTTEMLRADEDMAYRQVWATVLAEGQWQGEVHIKDAEGTPFPIWLSVTGIHDQGGRIVNYIMIVSNLSELRAHQLRVDLHAQSGAIRNDAVRTQVEARDMCSIVLPHAARTGQVLYAWHHDRINATRPAEPSAGVEKLSDRESEIFVLIAKGYENREIAQKLYVSVKTVETYKKRLMDKLGVTTRSEVVDLALRNGMLSNS